LAIILLTVKLVPEIETGDYLAFFISAIICADGFLDYSCAILEEKVGGSKGLYMALMLFGAAYNGGLAYWGSYLQKNAMDDWQGEYG